MKDYRIGTIVSKIRTALDKIDRDDIDDPFDNPERDQLKVDLLCALDLLEKHEYE